MNPVPIKAHMPHRNPVPVEGRKKKRTMLRLLVILIALTGLSMAVPLALAVFYNEPDMAKAFGFVMAAALLVAAPVLFVTRGQPIRFSASGGFLLVFLAWAGACFLGALPYYLPGYIPRFDGAVFESASGFTTTGTSLITDLAAMPRSLIFWRAQTHWLGGMGMVVLTVALLPLLGVGGFQLLKAEVTGPDKDRITPRITGTAKLLWLMYIILTAAEALLLFLAGMDVFDAVVHAFSTIATGGFSSRNGSIGHYNSPAIEWIVIVFMLVAGFNFSLLYRLFQRKFRELYYNSEARAYVCIIAGAVTLIAFSMLLHADGEKFPAGGIRQAFFFTASVLTTTGFTAGNHMLWPAMAQGVLFMLMIFGGCSGSTAGGIKVIRHVVLFKQAKNELQKILYPRGVFSVRLNNKVGRKDVVYGVAGFVFVYFAMAAAGALVTASSGLDFYSSLNASLSSLGNIGLGLGNIGSPEVFLNLPGYVKWVLSFLMVAGRLELWTAIVFLSRSYWR